MKQMLKQAAHRMLPAYLCLCLIFPPGLCRAKPISASLKAPAAGALPVLRSGQIQSGWSTSENNAAHYLQVNQTTSKATIEWNSFDIGSRASVHFKTAIFRNRPEPDLRQQSQPDIRQAVSHRQHLFNQPERNIIWERVQGERELSGGLNLEYDQRRF